MNESVHQADIDGYVSDVLTGVRPACQWEIAACLRHKDDYEKQTDDDYLYRFDWKKADKVINFIQLLPHTKGRWAKKRGADNRIKLEPWQKFNIACIFGWVKKSNGLRRFGIAYICVPRKNGKSILAAGIGLYMLVSDGEYGAEVYCGATSEKQALEVFKPAKKMVEMKPSFKQYYQVAPNARSISRRDGSAFVPVIGKPGDGASPSCAIVDEYHEHDNEDLYDTMLTGMGAREQPLMLVITTAGSNIAGPCYALQSDVQAILNKTENNIHDVFGIIYSIDKDDDWTTEEALIKANPNYGISVGSDYLLAKQNHAVQTSRKQNVFKTKHLNLWVTARDAWMNMEWWARQAGPVAVTEVIAKFPVYKGIDLASKHDLTSDVNVAVKIIDGVDHYYVSGRHYLPEDVVDDEDNRNATAYQGWVHDGHLIATEGNIIDYDYIEGEIAADQKRLDLQEMGFDPHGATQLAQRLATLHQVETVEVPQTWKHLSEPMKWLEAMTKAGRLHHDNNPVMNWMMSNVTVRPDANENIFPRKENADNKIDGAVALIIAVSRAMAKVEHTPISVEHI